MYRAIFAIPFTAAARAAIEDNHLLPEDLDGDVLALRSGKVTAEEILANCIECRPEHEQGWRDMTAAMVAVADAARRCQERPRDDHRCLARA